MKYFIKKLTIFLTISVLLLFVLLTIIAKKDGKLLDSFYLKFTSKHNGGLIIGTSKAAQALEPSIIDSDQYNFAFSISHSPFDSTYLNLIKKYHTTQAFDINRKHIVCVDPWSVFTIPNNQFEMVNPNFNKILNYPILNPNYFYMKDYINVLDFYLNRSKNYVNHSGRLVINLDFQKLVCDSAVNFINKIGQYRKKQEFKFGFLSNKRIKILKEVISYLRRDGKVILVRLPVHNRMLELETIKSPNFDLLMSSICKDFNIQYMNMMPLRYNYLYTDGNHVWNGDSYKLTNDLNKLIK